MEEVKRPDQPYGYADITDWCQVWNRVTRHVSMSRPFNGYQLPNGVLTFHVESSDPWIGRDLSIADVLLNDG